MNSEENISRAELIRSARESCSQNLINTKHSSLPLVYKGNYSDGIMKTPENKKIKEFFMYTRILLAIGIFIAIVAVDKFNFKIQGLDSNKINQTISYNLTVDDINKFVKGINGDKILEVFNNFK